IILIVFDTLRRDVLPMYGGRADMPNLNEFAKDAVIFPNAISPSPWTYPSHISLITGLYPLEHEGHEYFNETKNEFDLNINYKGKTVTEKLNDKGYNTIGLTANGVIGPESGFDKGFNYFEHIPPDALYSYELKKAKEIFPDGNINLKKIYKFNEILKLYKLYKKMNILLFIIFLILLWIELIIFNEFLFYFIIFNLILIFILFFILIIYKQNSENSKHY
ncbi:MAG: sulfatase-like hydrolase/transferase, partial [Thermodesulfovibrio sp.]